MSTCRSPDLNQIGMTKISPDPVICVIRGINEAHITQIHDYLENQDSELAKQFADTKTSTKASISTDSTKGTSQNLLSRLKAQFFGDRYDMGQQEIAYSAQEHEFNIKLAQANLMRFVA